MELILEYIAGIIIVLSILVFVIVVSFMVVVMIEPFTNKVKRYIKQRKGNKNENIH